jgi:integrase/recombinase XerD
LKRRQPQVYPLQRSVAEALSRYIDTIRPAVPYPEVFIRLQAPRLPISGGAIYHIVSERLRALGVEVAHLGPHAGIQLQSTYFAQAWTSTLSARG